MTSLFAQTKDPRVSSFISKIPAMVGSWAQPLDKIIKSDQMNLSILEVFKEAWAGKKVFPKSQVMFRAFKECDYDNLKVVFILQDPYHQEINGVPVADGIPMSCSNTQIEQPSLKLVYNEIERTAYHYKWSRNPDLVRWSNQGILLLNTALTVEKGKPDSHSLIWSEVTRAIIKHISDHKENIIFVFFGRKAQNYSYLVSDNHHKFNVIHPAAAAYSKTEWDSKGLFPNINNILKESLKKEIVW